MQNKGMTLIGMLLTVLVIYGLGLATFRVVPAYIQYYEVLSSVKSLSKLTSTDFSSDMQTNINTLKTKLMNQFYVNGIEDVKADDVKITSNANGDYDVSVQYDVKKPLWYNMSLLIHFDVNEEVKPSGS